MLILLGPSCSKADQRLTRVFFSCVQSIFSDNFLMLFLELPIINLQTNRIKTEMLFQLSNLNSNLALTLGYLNPALNNLALESKRANLHIPFATKCLLVIILIFAHFAFLIFFHDPQKNTSKFSVTYVLPGNRKNKSPERKTSLSRSQK